MCFNVFNTLLSVESSCGLFYADCKSERSNYVLLEENDPVNEMLSFMLKPFCVNILSNRVKSYSVTRIT